MIDVVGPSWRQVGRKIRVIPPKDRVFSVSEPIYDKNSDIGKIAPGMEVKPRAAPHPDPDPPLPLPWDLTSRCGPVAQISYMVYFKTLASRLHVAKEKKCFTIVA